MSDESGSPLEASAPVDGLVDALVQASFTTMGVLSRVAGEHDVSLTQLRVLAILRDRRVTMSALAEHLGLEKSTMSGLIQRAEGRGLVQRGRGLSDGRAVEVFLTDRGMVLAEQVGADVRGLMTPWTARLDAPDRALLQQLLARVLGG
ncbi:MAG: MarR family winged helix-turn-helix transcriptional regulator [Janthinobacterium lividum]